MDNLDKSIASVVDKLNELVTANAQDAVNLGLTVVKINCIQALLVGFMALAVASFLFYQANELIKEINANAEYNKVNRYTSYDRGYKESEGCTFGAGTCLIGGAFLSIGVFVNLFNVYNWVGLFEPKVVLAKAILDTVLK